ncbi:pre-peptidase C-terminal domain-containing protein [Chitinimonas sp. BJB300]|uniref:pre-peptidase C-terminal domain-containing protein n=1 Tax=Chitinimonas sp. BJB300 TaxID=1559339 RepID=UPI0013040208|nr:pre-peptidase C-terminal domain-containing protein [Chitinimonas sp. BJB300]
MRYLNRTRLLTPLLATLLASLSGTALAQSTVELGTSDTVINILRMQRDKLAVPNYRAMDGQSLAVEVRDFYDKDGLVSISGYAKESKNSVFFLKGTRSQLHGYLALHDKRTAYEYRTDEHGVVKVTPVPITKVYPDFDEGFQRRLDKVFEGEGLAVIHPVYSTMALQQAPHIGPYPGVDVTRLESKPGSPWVFYLNTTAVMNGSTPLNGVTKEQMYRTWQSVADQYSMLKLNVTTNRQVYDAARAANPLRTGIINYVNQDGRSYAPIHSFGTTSAGTLFRNPASGWDYGYGIGMTASHEVGHQMGMLHDGGGQGGEYFEGIPAFQWCPIMGNYWYGGGWANQLFTWSKGEYATASNQEDDLRIMNVEENVPYADDDNVNGKALVLRTGGELNPADNWGQIERTTDTDTFTFSLTATGTLNLRVDPIEYLRMLDVDATLYNAEGQVVANSNLPVNRSAEFVGLSLPAGSYRLVIQGGAEGTPQNGFSKYSSLGFYALKGTLSTTGEPPSTPLTSGVPMPNQAGATGSWTYYRIAVPNGSTALNVSIAGNNGDADMFVRAGAIPSGTVYTCKADGPTSAEGCTVNAPGVGTYYVGVYGYAAYNGLTVKATVSP